MCIRDRPEWIRQPQANAFTTPKQTPRQDKPRQLHQQLLDSPTGFVQSLTVHDTPDMPPRALGPSAGHSNATSPQEVPSQVSVIDLDDETLVYSSRDQDSKRTMHRKLEHGNDTVMTEVRSETVQVRHTDVVIQHSSQSLPAQADDLESLISWGFGDLLSLIHISEPTRPY